MSEKDFTNENAPLYLRTFVSFYEPWKANKFFGGGIKNFRYYCLVTNPKSVRKVCNRHPHNYYLEFLAETGLFGYISFMIFVIFSIYRSLKNFIENQNLIILASLLYFVFSLMPLIPTGSFFTTFGATLFWINYGFMISNKKNSIFSRVN